MAASVGGHSGHSGHLLFDSPIKLEYNVIVGRGLAPATNEETCMMQFNVLVPAYGRDYRNANQVLGDWRTGKDFQCAVTGSYCSIRDFGPGSRLPWIRYNKLRSMVRAIRLI